MAKEPDQTKWVGIRPTDPSENIPVTESTPLTQVKVEPLAVGTEFKTLTKKRSPAISDVQAIESVIALYSTGDVAVDRYDVDFAIVPVGKLWIITHIGVFASASWGGSQAFIRTGVEYHALWSGAILSNVDYMSLWNGYVLLKNPEYVRVENRVMPAGTTVHVSLRGYQISIY